MKITLNKLEMNLALLSGTERMMQNHKNGLNTQKKYLDPDVNGMAGEIAVAKYFNRYPDLTIGPHYSGYDLMIAGKKVDVKTTTRNPGWLQAKLKKKVTDADIYIMVTADMPHYTIQGGATAQDLIQQHNIKDTGYGPNYTLEMDQLTPLNILWQNA